MQRRLEAELEVRLEEGIDLTPSLLLTSKRYQFFIFFFGRFGAGRLRRRHNADDTHRQPSTTLSLRKETNEGDNGGRTLFRKETNGGGDGEDGGGEEGAGGATVTTHAQHTVHARRHKEYTQKSRSPRNAHEAMKAQNAPHTPHTTQ